MAYGTVSEEAAKPTAASHCDRMIKIDAIPLGEEEEKRSEISLDLQKIYE